MARKKHKKIEVGLQPGSTWMITFADLCTLLLTFFVLLLSMSSLDESMLSRITLTDNQTLPKDANASSISKKKKAYRVKELLLLLEDGQTVQKKEDSIRSLLFSDSSVERTTTTPLLKKNIRILEHPRGFLITISATLLFSEGTTTLSQSGKSLLKSLAPFLDATEADIAISAFAGKKKDEKLSSARALAVLDAFLYSGLEPVRFSISGYGSDRPLYSPTVKESQTMNERIEVLLKLKK